MIMKNEMLTDESINLAQNHLHEAFPLISGLQDTAIGASLKHLTLSVAILYKSFMMETYIGFVLYIKHFI